MIKKVPVAGSPVAMRDLAQLFFPPRDAEKKLAERFELLTGLKNIFFVSSGAAAFYIILKALSRMRPDKDEVILPAYTAPIMAVVIKKAGLKVILSDIKTDDFNMDAALVEKAVSGKTLCIVATHMFGIPFKGVDALKKKFGGIFVVEDCAQAMGSGISGNPVGVSGDCGFFSFNRGKNLPTYGGGMIASDSSEIAGMIRKLMSDVGKIGLTGNLAPALQILIFSIVMNSFVYGALYPLISLFKSDAVAHDFSLRRYSKCQASAALSMLERFDDMAHARYENGMAVIKGLHGISGLILPDIGENQRPVFNRLPVVFKNKGLRERAESAMKDAGFETSHMYRKPLHHIFDLGYGPDLFGNSVFAAENLLTLPAHPLLDADSRSRMVDVLRRALG